MSAQLIVGLVERAFDGCVLDGSVHPFDLPVCPGMLGLGQAMIDIVLGAGVFEDVRPDGLSGVEGRPRSPPESPSTTAIRMSPTPRFLTSFITWPAPSGSLDYAVSLDGPPLSLWRSHEEPGP
jgi:hypothetical protein